MDPMRPFTPRRTFTVSLLALLCLGAGLGRAASSTRVPSAGVAAPRLIGWANPTADPIAVHPSSLLAASRSPTGDLGSAVRFLKARDYPSAQAEVDAWLGVAAGRDHEVLGIFVRGRLEEAQGLFEEALQSYRSIRGADRGLMVETARGEGRSLVALARPLDAAPRFKAAADTLPEGPFKDLVLKEGADALLAGGRATEAHTTYTELMERADNADKPALRLQIARAEIARGNRSEGVSILDELHATSSNCRVADEAGGVLAETLGGGRLAQTSPGREIQRVDRLTNCAHWAEASANLKALEGVAAPIAVEEGWLDLWYKQWDLPQVISYSQTRLAQELDDASRVRLLRWQARAIWRSGDAATAADLRLAAATLGKGKPSLDDTFAAALLYVEAHNFARARQLLQEVLAGKPTRHQKVDALWYIAWSEVMEGHTVEARTGLEALVTEYPDENRGEAALYWLARLSIRDGDGPGALERLRQLDARESDSYYNHLARTLKLREAAEALPGGGERAPSIRTVPGQPPVAELPQDPLATRAQGPVLPALAPWTTAFPQIPPAGSTLLLDLPSPLRPAPPPDLETWSRLGRTSMEALHTTYATHSREVEIAWGLARAGFIAEAAPWLEEAIRRARKEKGTPLAKLAGEQEKLYWTFWYLHHPMQAIRLDPGAWPFPRFDTVDAGEIDRWRRRYPRAYPDSVASAHIRWGVDPSLIYGIMRTESVYGSEQVSPVGARGLMQIMPDTGKQIAGMLGEPYTADDLFEPDRNISYGAWYLSQLLERFEGQLPLAAAAYNAGPKYVSMWAKRADGTPIDVFIEEIPIRQTRDYVKKVLRAMAIYRQLYAGGSPLPLRAEIDGNIGPGIDF